MHTPTQHDLPFSLLRLSLSAVALAMSVIASPTHAGTPTSAEPTGDYAACINEDSAKAVAACTRSIALNHYRGKDLAKLHVSRAVEYYRNGDNDAAIADADAAIRQDPTFDAAYCIRGLSRHDKGDYDHAIADFSEGIKLDPADSMFNEQRGKSWLAKGDVARAITDFDTRIARAPRESSGFMNRALVWTKIGDRDRAIADLDIAVALEPQNAIALYRRGILRRYSGDVLGGDRDIAEATRIDRSWVKSQTSH